ncbi:outer membrane protein assembly factor BamB family protein [Stutzerimonas azotifigens]|uniref:PQQ-binding-like beta-propeller repeat protein n=1 Tax=Stutzerimonas azotifigens TaxID=291995 RepID=A0ABR5Z6B8_9GAMM|nr:PQQ-binding-like beta-propeller repeat protein [Stutzerimonas azotifigens]MBA1275740.1 PQQ-binding-like beta-propeller repeat protein [Stutzerimonas azotifigens]
MRITAASLLALSLSGCSLVEEVFLTPGEKVNRAFPPSAEVRTAEETLRNLLDGNKSAQKSLAAKYGALREIRGLTCSKNLTVARFDSVAEIKKLPVSRNCLNEQDEILLRFLQIKQVEQRLSQPALRPMTPLETPTLVSPGVSIYSGISAPTAGVAVLSGTRGELLSIEVPSGKPIVRLPTLSEGRFNEALLSPNGRVLALPGGYGKGVTFFDTETGAVLWQDRTISKLLAWLPDISAAMANDSGGQLSIIDFQTGEHAVEVPGLKRPSWAVPLQGGQVATGTGRTLALIAFERGITGIQGTILKSFTIQTGQGVTSLRPTSMLNGRSLFFVSSRDLMTFDLDSGQETLWATGDFIANRYAKLSESTVLVDSYERSVNTRSWALNIEDASLSPIETKEGSAGILYELDGRAGFMRRDHDGVWFGLHLQQGKPVALADFLSERNLDRQMAKLETMTQQSSGQNTLGGGGSRLSRPPYTAQMPFAVPPPRLDYGQPSVPFADVAKDAQIEGIGVYESSATLPNGPGNRPGSVSLAIRPTAKPLILVLSSYESVTWRITQGQHNIKLILLSSYYPSSVEGAGTVRTVVINGGSAYSRESDNYARLRRAVMGQIGKDIQIFQGSYQGSSFSIGGQ